MYPCLWLFCRSCILEWVCYYAYSHCLFSGLKDPGYHYGITCVSHQHASPEVSGISVLHHLRIRPNNTVILFAILPCFPFVCKPHLPWVAAVGFWIDLRRIILYLNLEPFEAESAPFTSKLLYAHNFFSLHNNHVRQLLWNGISFIRTRGRSFPGDSNVQPHQNFIIFSKLFLHFTSLQFQEWQCLLQVHQSWHQNTLELKVHTAPVQRGNPRIPTS